MADFVEAWKRDPKTTAVIKEELGTLTTHEAFKVKQTLRVPAIRTRRSSHHTGVRMTIVPEGEQIMPCF